MTIQETKKLVKTKIKVDHNGLWTVKLADDTYDITPLKNFGHSSFQVTFDVSKKPTETI